LKGDRVAILLPQQRQVYGFAKGLQEAGLEVEIPARRGKSDKEIEDIDFNSDRPKLLTYHSAKGLTFDTVCLPRLVSRSFSQTDDRVKKLLFVGVTRATQWVYLSGVSGSLISPLVALLDLEDAGKITVRRSSAGLFGSLEPDTSPPVQPIDDFDDLF
jgi:superfamily I DNA/RNA helicase